MSKPEIQTRESIAEDYKNTLQGLIPICEKYIEMTASMQAQVVQMQSLFIQLKTQAKQMIDGLDSQMQVTPRSSAAGVKTMEPDQQLRRELHESAKR